jgi:5S rRNA maturation endonuclease (ribonuclease M5)
MTTAADLARILKAKRSGSGWIARCPAHDDRRDSLSIGEGENGRLLAKCFAGCSFADILKAAGVEPTKSNGEDRQRTKTKGRIVATYDYTDARGELVYQVCRLAPKSFFQRRPDGKGDWINGRGDTPSLPYRLPQLVDSFDLVFVVEGEKDADNLAKLGLIATTNAGGSDGEWPEAWGRYFDGRHVVVIPDNDEAGRKHAHKVARALGTKPATIKLLELPDQAPKGDVSDWLAKGGTADQLLELADQAPDCQPGDDDEATSDQDDTKPPLPPITIIDLRQAKEPGPFRWIARDWLPCRRVAGLWGAGGGGKSTITQLLLTCCVVNQPWFGVEIVEPGPALGFFTEDDEDELLRRQFRINETLGVTMADLSGKLHLIPRLGLPNTLAIHHNGALELTPVFEALKQEILDRKPKITAIDNLMQVYGAEQVNANHITGFVNAWSGVAHAVTGSVLLLGHPGKAEGNEYAGPYAWDASVRSRMFLAETKGGTRKLTRRKANNAPKDAEIELEWRNGLYLPVDPECMTYGDRLDAEMRHGQAKQAFLDALDRFTAQGQGLSDSNKATSYAPKMILQRKFADGFNLRELERAMIDLLDEGRIKANEPIGKDRHRNTRYGFVRTT